MRKKGQVTIDMDDCMLCDKVHMAGDCDAPLFPVSPAVARWEASRSEREESVVVSLLKALITPIDD